MKLNTFMNYIGFWNEVTYQEQYHNLPSAHHHQMCMTWKCSLPHKPLCKLIQQIGLHHRPYSIRLKFFIYKKKTTLLPTWSLFWPRKVQRFGRITFGLFVSCSESETLRVFRIPVNKLWHHKFIFAQFWTPHYEVIIIKSTTWNRMQYQFYGTTIHMS